MSYCVSQLSQVRKHIVAMPMTISVPSLTSWCNIRRLLVTYSEHSISPSLRAKKLLSLEIPSNLTHEHYWKLSTLATCQTASWRAHLLKTLYPSNQYPYWQTVP